MINLNKILLLLIVVTTSHIGLSQTAIAEEMACTMALNGPCTRDINPCGNPSMCVCPEGYDYNAAMGQCVIDDISKASHSMPPIQGSCVIPPSGMCTLDINPCGHPSMCQCPEGSRYNATVGQCIKELN
jgi:hypothetical protein